MQVTEADRVAWYAFSDELGLSARTDLIGPGVRLLARHRLQGWSECKEAVAKITHENGPVVIDMTGEDLAWRPLDYGTWTPFLTSSKPESL